MTETLEEKIERIIKKTLARIKYPDMDEGYRFSRYNITASQYMDLFVKQNACCPICGLHRDEFWRDFVIDHDHETGKVRGLLCMGCNTQLGVVEKYLKAPKKWDEYLKKI